MSGWDDLFALAAGEEGNETPAHDCTVSDVSSSQLQAGNELNDNRTIKESWKKKNKQKRFYEEEPLNKNKKKKKRILSRKASKEQRLEILASRLDVPKLTGSGQHDCFWLPWMKSGPPLIHGEKCSEWENNDNRKSNTKSSLQYCCKKCNKSPLYHSIEPSEELKESVSSEWTIVLNLFLSIRNIRACCSCMFDILHSSSPQQQSLEKRTMIRSYTRECYQRSQKLQSLVTNFIASALLSTNSQLLGEGKLFREKCHKLVRSSQQLYSKAKQSNETDFTNHKNKKTHQQSFHDLFEEIITLIIHCDSLYYRLYYLQITHLLPFAETCTKNTNSASTQKKHFHISDLVAYVPHPSTYFGVPNMSWNVQQGFHYIQDIIHDYIKECCIHSDQHCQTIPKQEFSKLLSTAPENVKKSEIHFMMEIAVQNMSENDYSKMPNHDPLSFLHNIRSLEGLLLFRRSGWLQSTITMKKTTQSLKKHHQQIAKENQMSSNEEEMFYARHETPAPTIVMQWRDSCRDFLCNLYAYATIAPSIICKIKTFIETKGLSGGVVEVGAGTGFVAHIFRRNGMNVNAWDISPPSSTSNDYHGQTPSFTNVKKGNVEDALRSHFNKCDRSQRAEMTALLLCYPPPNSEMACRAVKQFSKLGGRYIIHIGEFKGLTGSEKFETFLKTGFKCQLRYPCLTWGNDASNVTIWCRSETSKYANDTRVIGNISHQILLPCSYCHEKEGIRRSRLSRLTVYCSSKCFDYHTKIRNQLLMFHLTNVLDENDDERIEFDSDQHFVKV